MGGATQSKLAFISTTIKKKNEDLSKSKNADADEKTKVYFWATFSFKGFDPVVQSARSTDLNVEKMGK